jgi:ComF family protein
MECTLYPPSFARTFCVADYQFPWDGLLQRLKYGGEPGVAKVLAPLMHRARLSAKPAALATRFIPIPLSVGRLRERRYNQALELCRQLGKLGHQPVLTNAVWRVMESPHAQATLSRHERLQALSGAFMCNPGKAHEWQGQHITLVDDVLTTGATALEAARVLLRAGAAQVEVLVFARTPKPETID